MGCSASSFVGLEHLARISLKAEINGEISNKTQQYFTLIFLKQEQMPRFVMQG
jgi:hypothetical protein